MAETPEPLKVVQRPQQPFPELSRADLEALCLRQNERIGDLLNGCNALLGLIQLVCARDDMPTAIMGVLQNNHRIAEARAAIARAEGST